MYRYLNRVSSIHPYFYFFWSHPWSLNVAGRGNSCDSASLLPQFDRNSPVTRKEPSRRSREKINLKLFSVPPFEMPQLHLEEEPPLTLDSFAPSHLQARAERSLINCSGISSFTVCILPVRGSLRAAALSESLLSEHWETNAPVQPGWV